MLKKEFREILIPTLLRLSVLAIFPLLSLLGVSKYIDTYFYQTFLSLIIGLVTIWIASTYGSDAFRSEYKDGALEYLLSFPLSKFKIILYKLIPRVSILIILVTLNLVLDFMFFSKQFEGEGVVFYIIIIFSPLCLVTFFLMSSFFVSMFFEHKRSRIYFNIAGIISMITISLGVHSVLMSTSLIRHVYDISFSAGCLLVLAVLCTAFVSVYRKLDLKAAKLFGRMFTLRALPPLLVLTALGILLFII